MKVPGGSDYVEFMLDSKVAPHFCLLVPDMEKAKARLESSSYRVEIRQAHRSACREEPQTSSSTCTIPMGLGWS